MVALITGGTGFIGSYLCEELIKDGEVVCLDDFSSGREKNIIHLTNNKNFILLKQDITKELNLNKKIDVVYHFASPAAPPQFIKYPVKTALTNAIGSYNVLELARKNDSKVMLASTSEIYGDSEVIPTPESYKGIVSSTGPRSCYDESKRFSETLFKAYEKQYGIDTRIIRIFNTYGPRIREDSIYGRVVPRFIIQALRDDDITVYGDGTQTRSFCYISDLIKAVMLVSRSKESRGEIYNIGNPDEIKIIDLAKLIKKLMKSKSKIGFLPLPEDDPKRRCPNISKISKLGWKPEINLEQGLIKVINYFREGKCL